MPADSHDNPVVFTITGSGWSLGQSVFIEQCDGVPPTVTGWDPSSDCDTGTAPAPALADAHGDVSFPATSHNYAFPVFRGASPSGLFNCLSPHQPEPHNGLASFRTCQVRMSSSNTNPTADQAFIAIALPDSSHGYPATSQASPPGLGPAGLTGAGANGTNGAGADGAGGNGTGSGAAGSASGSSASGSHSSSGSSGGWLASTGADILLGVLIGLVLIGAGLVLVRWRRRQHQPA